MQMYTMISVHILGVRISFIYLQKEWYHGRLG